MVNELNRLKEWRAEEIVKIFLLKSNSNFEIIKFDNPIYDFFVKFEKDKDISFAIEVKTNRSLKSRLRNYFEKMSKFEKLGLITIPVLLIIIDDKQETGEIDFSIFPSLKEKKLLIQKDHNFINLNIDNFYSKVNIITEWYETESAHQ